MARILGYIASSLDGFIATGDDKLDWLFQYNDMELGEHDYKSFLKRVRTLVMGRGTYDFLANDPAPWDYEDHRVLVVTSRPIDDPKGKLEVRSDVESGMAKTLASEYCAEVTTQSFRIHGGYGYSKEYEIERLMREAPFLLIGEGTSEIQKTIISRGLLKEYRA